MGRDILAAARRLQTTLTTHDGAASALLSEDGKVITVTQRHEGRDVLVLRVEPGEGRLTLGVAEGDLRLRAEAGAIELEGATAVRLDAPKLEGRADEARFRVGSWHLVAGVLRERAGHLMRDVEQTLHTTAGQVTTRVRGLYRLATERTSLRSKDDTAIDGKRVLLG